MILYVNGDSHTAAAEAANPHAFAEDDGDLFYMGRAPHPANLAISWGKILSNALRSSFYCGAESASSNVRILRTTREWIEHTPVNQDLLVIIQWSTWEREEWLHNGNYYDVNAGGHDILPTELKDQYKDWVVQQNDDMRIFKSAGLQEKIFKLHQELCDLKVKHLFFNALMPFLHHTKVA